MPEDPSGEQPTLFSGSGDEPTVSLPPGREAGPHVRGGPRLAPGERFGPYEIQRPLGRGGMGEVYEAVHVESGHRVALKLLAGESAWSPERRQRFLREGRLAAAVNHPHSLYIYGTEEIEGIPVISMELATGATLKDRVDSEGPLSPSEAVDATLQMIDGLQAAQRAGVLHRDIKPGNCFVDREGNVKIGDFGLATSSGAPEMTQLTAPGTILGTPAYAAPEQLRGDAVDVRSDIYAVGGTLYFLLTGRPPFAKEAGLQLMAAILEKTPAAPHRIARGIPSGLSRLVLRCLEKNPSSRPQSYEDLRSALEPFGTQALPPARPLRRLTAGLIDYAWVQVLLSTVLYSSFQGSATDQPGLFPLGFWDIPILLFAVLVTGLLEGAFAATPGKWMTGLRVWGAQKAGPGIHLGLARAALFWSPMLAIDLLRLLLAWTSVLTRGSGFDVTLDGIGDFSILVHFLGASRARGWRGAHDRITGTRVVRRAATPEPVADAAATIVAEPAGEARLGPYLAPHSAVAAAKPGDIILGHDPVLRRKVWIHLQAEDAQPVSEMRHSLCRRGRLRWLNGRRTADGAWDAYQAVDGMPFANVVRTAQSWVNVRQWLYDLAEELHKREGDDAAAQATLSLDRVWITADGNALLLDFPAPGAASAVGSPASTENPNLFLAKVAEQALAGEPGHTPPLPLHARRFLRALVEDPARAAEDTLAQARELLTKPAVITRRRRLGQMVLPASPFLALGLIGMLGGLIYHNTLRNDVPDLPAFNAALKRLQELEARDALDPEETTEREALETLLAGPFRESIFGDRPLPDSYFQFPNVTAADRATLRRVFAAHSAPTSEEVELARERLATFLAEKSKAPALGRLFLGILAVIVGAALLGTVLLAPLSLLVGLALPGGIVGKLVGAAVVTQDGERASRWRCFLRGIVAWSPALMLWAFFVTGGTENLRAHPNDPVGIVTGLAEAMKAATSSGLLPLAVLLFLVGTIWAIARPSRGIQDLIARTNLVPE
jgi:serine/threonine protein kinase